MEKLVNFFHYCIINHKKTQIFKKVIDWKKIGQKKSAINKNWFGKKRNNKKMAEIKLAEKQIG